MKKLWKLATKTHLLKLLTALWMVMKDKRTPLGAKVIGGAVLAYALSPIDLIPDFIPVVGYADDAAVIAWVLNSIAEELKDFKNWEQGT